MKRRFAFLLILVGLAQLPERGFALGPRRVPSGVWVQFTHSNGAAATVPLNRARFYVEEGGTPTSLLPAGSFSAEMIGFVRARLRSEFRFSVETNGEVTFLLNENEAWSSDSGVEATDPITLEKGNNALRIVFKSPETGPAFLRLSVSSDGEPFRPFTARELRAPSGDHPWLSELERDTSLLRGRSLFLEGRCLACHESLGELPDLYSGLDAPSLEGVGDRLSGPWIRAWLNEPKALRPTARMPMMLHGADNAVEPIAAYLAGLHDGAPLEAGEGDPVVGSELFLRLNCVACHTEPGFGPDPEGIKVSLDYVGAKFKSGALEQFLRQPEAHYNWIRMPNFRLNEQEAQGLASYLRAATEGVADFGPEPSSELFENGMTLYHESGCAACHDPDSAKAADIALAELDSGCMATTPIPGVPFYDFDPEERSDLLAFLEGGLPTLERNVASEFASNHVEGLNCQQCHGELDGVPDFVQMVGKLVPQWTERLLANQLDYRPRPWLEQRMPGFPSRAEAMARGLAQMDGFAPTEPLRGREDEDLAAIGAQLVSPVGGFNCVQCHAVGADEATEVFEAPGINFAYTHERLRRDFFHQWVENPQAIDPLSRMPAFFFDGKSPLTDVLDGDAQAQIAAMWEFLAAGRDIETPETNAPAESDPESLFE